MLSVASVPNILTSFLVIMLQTIQYNNYLHRIYIKLCIMCNLEMIQKITGGYAWLYANSGPFYLKGVTIRSYGIHQESWNQSLTAR